MTPSTALKAQWQMGLQWLQVTAQAWGRPQSAPPTTMRRHTTEAPEPGVSPHHPVCFLGFVFVLFFSLSECCRLRVCEEGIKAHAEACGVGVPARAHPGSKFPSRIKPELWGFGGRNLGREGTGPKWFPVASPSLPFSLPISLWFLYPQKLQEVLMKEKQFFAGEW